jgi:hypothetical protein
MRTRTLAHLLAAGVLSAGCAGIIGDSGQGDGEDGHGTDSEALCSAGVPTVGDSPLRRLTRAEFDNTIRDLLDLEVTASAGFVPDELVAGFAANSVSSLSKLQLEDFLAISESLAQQALDAHESEWLPCDIADSACVQPFLSSMGQKAFRRPLSPELEQSLVSLYETARGTWGARKGVELALMAMLNSPYFLYLLEIEPTTEGEVVPLDSYELASRLSYFVWHSMPDDELFAAAADGQLDTVEGIESQARRMLADERAARALDEFHGQWLELGVLQELVKDPELFPDYDEALAESMKAETLAFTRDLIESGGSADLLLTATHSFVDGSLAPLYGLDLPAGSPLTRVDLDSSQRAGILTQAAFLTSRAHAAEPSWVLRGKFVREKLLCEELPAPPPNVDQKAANDPDRLTNPDCASCHIMMDPIGFGFDNYDAIGQFRIEDESGKAIDSSGEVIGNESIGTFVGAVELAKELAQSDQVKECMAQQWFRYATRRVETKEDDCSIDSAYEHFAQAGHDISELIVAIATSDAFRHRKSGN